MVVKNSYLRLLLLFAVVLLASCGKGHKVTVNVVGIKAQTLIKSSKNSKPNTDTLFDSSGGGVLEEGVLATLTLNAESALEIKGDGIYKFDKKLSDGEPYHVILTHGPTWQTCLLDNAQGVANGGVIINMTCTDKFWRHPTSFDEALSLQGTNTFNPKVAIDANGNAIVVWRQLECNYLAHYKDASWTLPYSTSDCINDGGTSIGDPEVAMDDFGNAIVTWRQSYSGQFRIYKSEYHGGQWSHPLASEHLISQGVGADDPQIVINALGNAVIAYTDFAGGYSHVYRSEYKNDSWIDPSSPSDHHSQDGGAVTYPKVAIDNNGSIMIVWSQTSGVRKQIFRSEYRDWGNNFWTWQNPVDINDFLSLDIADAENHELAMDNRGNSIMVWTEDDYLYKSEFRAGGWTDPDSSDDKIVAMTVTTPDISMDNEGNAILTWTSSPGTSKVYKSEYTNGSWTHPEISQNINPEGASAEWAQVAQNDNEGAIVVWEQPNASGISQVFMSEYRDGTWVHPKSLSEYISLTGTNTVDMKPQVAMSNNGDAIIVWKQRDSSGDFQVYVSHYR